MRVIFALRFGLCVSRSPAMGSGVKAITGDRNPPGYSALNVEVDTIAGPVTIDKSVIGYITQLEVNSLKKLQGILDNVTETAIVDVKLARKNYVSSFIQAPMTEPNYGPFPQYNVIFEDVPVEALMLSGQRRKYKSRIRNQLVEMLNGSTKQLVRSQSLFQNPRTESQNSLINQAKAAVSFLQDYEQFVEENSAPFQEIYIKTESVAPKGGDAPVIPPVKPRILDVNRTAEMLELKALEAEETVMLKSLKLIASKISR